MCFEVGGGEHIAVAGVNFVAHYAELSLGEIYFFSSFPNYIL